MAPSLDPDRTAVVLVEMQKQWTASGLYNWLIRGQLEGKNVLDNTRRLVRTARGAGVPIIHAPLVVDPEDPRGWLAHLTFGQIFTKGTARAEFAEGVYEEGDLVATGRYALDPFVGSNLEELLRRSGAETVLFGGFLTDQCAGKGVLTARRKGFDAYLLTDCSATVTRLQDWWIERQLDGRTMSSEAVLNEFQLPQS
jgi:nicotinamidase-related amidase